MLQQILNAANKHPGSRVSQLIRSIEGEERNHRSIVLLVREISEHAEYSIDFNIPLKYYLDLYEDLSAKSGFVLNEAGVLLFNSGKIYSQRLDVLCELIGRQILNLSNHEKDSEANKTDEAGGNQLQKSPKRCRKLLAEAPSDPYEVILNPKKLRKLTASKRFTVKEKNDIPRTLPIHTEQYIHPAVWSNATIPDLDNPEEVDSKRNYKLFTFHLEHRYNTLLPDINFCMHFKVKDYLDEELNKGSGIGEEEWPPLSDEYVERYLSIENRVFEREIPQNKSPAIRDGESESQHPGEKQSNDSPLVSPKSELDNNEPNQTNPLQRFSSIFDSALGCSLNGTADDQTLPPVDGTFTEIVDANSTRIDGITEPPIDQKETPRLEDDTDTGAVDNVDMKVELAAGNDEPGENDDHSKITIRFPGSDEVVPLSELTNEQKAMLTPKVTVTDILGMSENKRDVVISLDDEMKEMWNLPQDDHDKQPKASLPPLTLNILMLPEKKLRKKILFKFDADMDLFLRARLLKRRGVNNVKETRNAKRLRMMFENENDGTRDNQELRENTPIDFSENLLGFDGREAVVDFSVDEGCVDNGQTTDHNIRNSDDDQENIIEVARTAAESQQEEADEGALIPLSSMVGDNQQMNEEARETPRQDEEEALDTGIVDGADANEDDRPQSLPPLPHQTSLDEFSIEDSDLVVKKTPIQLWHERLQPILVKARERHTCDVHQLGREVIEDLENAETSGQDNISLDDVMQKKDQTHLTRVLLSSLIMVNKGQIDIKVVNQSCEEPSEWSDVQFKLPSVRPRCNVNYIASEVPRAESETMTKQATSKTKNIRKRSQNESDSDIEIGSPPTNVNLNFIKPLQPIVKCKRYSEDNDSGIFSEDSAS